jgi:hypothetical protein
MVIDSIKPTCPSRRDLASRNVRGNGAAAKKLRFQNPRHRRLPFTAWFAVNLR